jgi:DNA-binding NtrC family response regulator
MAAIPTELVESELFGHEKGAFTGATAKRIGKFEEANGGTIFLDEIGDLNLNLQSKLLRVLQEKEITRVGGNASNPIDVRIIVATHKDLLEEMQNNNFREDLYYRLLGLPIKLPPLRERGNDIVKLARLFVKDFSEENNMEPLQINADAVKKLLVYNYPGNVRELKAVMDLAMVMADSNEILPEDIIFTPRQSNSELLQEEKSLRLYTYEIIRFYLKKYNQNILKVAEVLDVGKSTIYRMIKEMEEYEKEQQ